MKLMCYRIFADLTEGNRMNIPISIQARRLTKRSITLTAGIILACGIAVSGATAHVFAARPTAPAAVVTYTDSGLNATVSGYSVTAVVTLYASANTTAQLAGVCARDTVTDQNYDFPLASNIL